MSKTAFVFPGQGSQALGMLADFADQTAVRQVFQEASGALGYDLWQLLQEGPESELNRTWKTQPALLAAGYALWRLWEQRGGLRPSMLAGHSLGEYTALTCAGVINLGDAVRLVEKRGKFMQEAVPEGTGAMAAILGLEDQQVRQACVDSAADQVVEAVNYNAPGQVVIAGDRAAVERAIEACKAAGAKRALPLPVSVPSHCALMRPAAERLAQELASVSFHAPEISVINNADVSVEKDCDAIRDALVRQLYSPVRWVETVQALAGQDVVQAYECGPGKVLAGLIKRTERNLNVLPLESESGFAAALEKGNAG